MKGYEFILKRLDEQREYIKRTTERTDISDERKIELLQSANGVTYNLRRYLIPEIYVQYFKD